MELGKLTNDQPAKKTHSARETDVQFLYQEPDLPYKFHSVDEQWQRDMCDFMGLRFRRPNKICRGGPDVPIGPPDPRAIKPIAGYGNCFFRFISYIITGTELQHMDVCRVIVDHMKFVDYYPPGYTSAEQYIQATRMDRFGTWGTDTEMVTLAHMLQTCIFFCFLFLGFEALFHFLYYAECKPKNKKQGRNEASERLVPKM